MEILEEKTPFIIAKRKNTNIDLTRNIHNISEELENTHKDTEVDLEEMEKCIMYSNRNVQCKSGSS